jgi:endonuclease/exonuclease/phosphatase (EEP) superfamily protein YafD
MAALLVAAGAVWTQWPLYRAGDVSTPTHTPSVRLMQANIFLGRADPAALVARIREERVDVLTVVELTPSAVQSLAEAGMAGQLPYSYVRARNGGGGAGVYSRYPLSGGEQLPGFALDNVRVSMAVPGAAMVSVYAVHVQPPWPQPVDVWAAELDRLNSSLRQRHGEPVLVGGDFNATYDHRRFRTLLDGSDVKDSAGMTDAAEYVGAGMLPTFPARHHLSIIAIDHIMVRDATPTSFGRLPLTGSDHAAVVADIALTAT